MTSQRRKARQCTFASAINMCEFHHERVGSDLEPAKQICGAGLEHEGLIAENDCFEFIVGQFENLIDRVPLEQDL
ncbi:hypothetical protein AAW51_0456 [Caldimonas brevitalea]|uniref:Uncharacterized protein n=1 Tax=Caldimonas brevitalea TaxID=413882 RepID=A0A0G3BCT9_9BURK|nr:hypothetical protein AAW51_0456 [Caldimonas brevitalea]